MVGEFIGERHGPGIEHLWRPIIHSQADPKKSRGFLFNFQQTQEDSVLTAGPSISLISIKIDPDFINLQSKTNI
jgi:hypothetical protein